MERNFFRRIELAFPVLDHRLKKRVMLEGLRHYLADNQLAWEMNGEGSYARKRAARAKPRIVQAELMASLGH